MTDSNDRRGSGRITTALAATGLAAFLVGCEVTEPQVLDTHTGVWETAPVSFPGAGATPPHPQDPSAPLYDEPIGPPEPGWQCDGYPCTDEQLQHAVETVEAVGGGN